MVIYQWAVEIFNFFLFKILNKPPKINQNSRIGNNVSIQIFFISNKANSLEKQFAKISPFVAAHIYKSI